MWIATCHGYVTANTAIRVLFVNIDIGGVLLKDFAEFRNAFANDSVKKQSIAMLNAAYKNRRKGNITESALQSSVLLMYSTGITARYSPSAYRSKDIEGLKDVTLSLPI
jgi:hypothetical protein